MPMRFEDVWRAMRSMEPIDNSITKSPVGSCRSVEISRPAPDEPAVPQVEPVTVA